MGMQLSPSQIAGLVARLEALEAQSVNAQMRGLIYGMVPSLNATNPTLALDFSVGGCRASDDTRDIEFDTAVVGKRLDQNFAVGNNAGMLDTGTKQNNMGYHAYAIVNPTTNVEDVVCSTSAVAPTMPAGFTKMRRLCSFMTDAAGLIRPMVWDVTAMGLMATFKPAGRVLDLNDVTNYNSSFLRQIQVPQGRRWWTRLQLVATGTSAAGMKSAILDPAHGVPVAMGATTDFFQLLRESRAKDSVELWQWTDANRQVYSQSNDAAEKITLMTLGWVDDRNAFD